jgi:hypothetical protein
MSRSWSQAEVEATVADYRAMLRAELSQEEFSKTEHRRNLIRLLDDRSEGSVERKHQNISAILIELGLPWIDGYKPLGNYQDLLFQVVEQQFEQDRILLELIRRDAQTGSQKRRDCRRRCLGRSHCSDPPRCREGGRCLRGLHWRRSRGCSARLGRAGTHPPASRCRSQLAGAARRNEGEAGRMAAPVPRLCRAIFRTSTCDRRDSRAAGLVRPGVPVIQMARWRLGRAPSRLRVPPRPRCGNPLWFAAPCALGPGFHPDRALILTWRMRPRSGRRTARALSAGSLAGSETLVSSKAS